MIILLIVASIWLLALLSCIEILWTFFRHILYRVLQRNNTTTVNSSQQFPATPIE